MTAADQNKYPLEVIEWYDAESDASWSSPQEAEDWAKKDFVAFEVGFVFFEDKDHIAVTSQIGSDGTIGNRTRIPKPWIKRRRKLTYGRTRDNGYPVNVRGKDTHSDGKAGKS